MSGALATLDNFRQNSGGLPVPYSADAYAELLGLKSGPMTEGVEEWDEVVRLYFLMTCMQRNRALPQAQQDIIWSEYCAKYLPGNIDALLDPPLDTKHPDDPELQSELKLNNAFFEMLVAIQHTPYFFKYLRSDAPVAAGGKRLAQVLAGRLLEQWPVWDKKILKEPTDRPKGYYRDVSASVLQLLSTILMASIKDNPSAVLSKDTKTKLLPLLRKWAKRHRKEFFGEVTMRVYSILSGDKGFNREVRVVRRHYKNWMTCANPSCESTSNLKACGRCQTVRYCSPEHQRSHWTHPAEPHKQYCHKTEY